MDNYQGNAIKYRNADPTKSAEKPKIEAVVSNATIKKKGPVERFVKCLLAENLSNLGSYLVYDVIAPAVGDAFYNIGISTLGAIFGKTPRSSGQTSSTTYHRAYGSQRSETKGFPRLSANIYDYNEIIFSSKNEADTVLSAMCDILEAYPAVSVSDFYQFAGQAANTTDLKWGWKNLSEAKVHALAGGGYTIRFPKAIPID